MPCPARRHGGTGSGTSWSSEPSTEADRLIYACLITRDGDGDGWLGIVPDLPGLELRALSAYEVERGLPAAIAAWLPAKPPRPAARLAYVRLTGRGEPFRTPSGPEALKAARSAIRALLGSSPPSDLANRLVDWDLELQALEPIAPAPVTRPGVAVGFVLEELQGEDSPEQIMVGRDAEGREVAVPLPPTVPGTAPTAPRSSRRR